MARQRILLLYPNERDMSLVPPVIALFTSLLKERGHQVSLFDCTGYAFDGKADPDVEREKNLFFKTANPGQHAGVKAKLNNMYQDFTDKVNDFKPTLIAMTVTESTFLRGLSLLDYLRNKKSIHIPTIVGGVFPTFAPGRVIKENSIDIVCVGEGENAIVDLCDRMEKEQPIENIPNLWLKRKDGHIIKNLPGKAVDINQLPSLDFSIFDDDRFYRPMRGNIYRMLPIETHRGCPYTCTFCNSPSQGELYQKQTKSSFFRKKSMEKIREEFINFRDNWKGNYVFFWADTFLAWNKKELAEFCDMYSEFQFPFWCQSRPETVADNVDGLSKLRMLKEVGLHHMSFGLEHGNEEFRKRIIGRNYSNKVAIDALKNPAKLDITFTINNIIGFPDETRKLAFDTIEVNRKIDSFNLSCSTFAPYHGTKLRDLAENRKYIPQELIAPPNTDYSVLQMPHFTKEDIYKLQRTFVMYVKFPKSRWKEIERAEFNDDIGNALWSKLRKEFTESYFQTPEPAINKVNM